MTKEDVFWAGWPVWVRTKMRPSWDGQKCRYLVHQGAYRPFPLILYRGFENLTYGRAGAPYMTKEDVFRAGWPVWVRTKMRTLWDSQKCRYLVHQGAYRPLPLILYRGSRYHHMAELGLRIWQRRMFFEPDGQFGLELKCVHRETAKNADI